LLKSQGGQLGKKKENADFKTHGSPGHLFSSLGSKTSFFLALQNEDQVLAFLKLVIILIGRTHDYGKINSAWKYIR
jgi:hypothetical protein